LTDAAPNALRDAIYLLCKRSRRILLVTLLCGGAAYAYGAANGPRYTATGRLLVQSASAGQERGQAARNEAEILRDPALIRAAFPLLQASLPRHTAAPTGLPRRFGAWWHHQLVGLGLAGDETPEAALVGRLGRALSVAAVPDTDVVEMRFSWPDPGFPATVVNTLLGEQQRLASGSAEAAQATSLAQTRLQDAQSQLAQIESRIAALPRLSGAAPDPSALEREKDRITSRLSATSSDAEALRLERDLSAKKLDAADKAYQGGGWVDNPDAPASASGAPALDQSFTDLLEKRGQLLAHLPPDSPKVKALDNQISAAREHAYQSVRQVLTTRLHAVDDRLAGLAAQTDSDQAALRALDDRLVELEALLGNRQEAATRVTELQHQLQDVRQQTDAAMHDAAGLRVLSQASVPAEPDFPSPIFVLWAGILGGLCLGLGSAILAERNRMTIDRPQDIARVLKIPVLASVPELR
jgi:uncharacterized protein involved in exopolysaccharide biosynthesis